MTGVHIRIDIDDQRVNAAMRGLLAAGQDLSEPFEVIGAYLERVTDQRFRDQQSPDGTPWAPLSPSYRATKKKNQDLILVLNGYLQSQMFYQAGRDELVFGSVMKYAAVQQFGARKGAFGMTRRGAPIPWGDIPARPFLGTNDADNRHIAGVFLDYIKESFTGG